MHRALAGCLVLFVLFPVQATAQGDDLTLRVGIKPAAPFVMVNESGEATGFSIDLIEAIASDMQPPRKVKFTVHEDISDHLEAVRSNQVDLGISATSFSSERERQMDFSVPFYQGGLGIVTMSRGSGLRFWDIVNHSELKFVFLWLTLFLVLCANIIWLTERGRSDTFDDRWHIGVSQAMWWTIVTMTTVGYGDFVPRKPLSRLLGILVIVVGIVLFGVAVGAFSSALTLRQLSTDIRVPDDLRNKPVAVIQDSIGEATLRQRGVDVVAKADLTAAFAAVRDGEVVAAVHDVAVLRHHVPRDAPQLTLVGPTFAERGYGITFPSGSKLREEVNVVLLELMESNPSRYQVMLEEWFETP